MTDLVPVEARPVEGYVPQVLLDPVAAGELDRRLRENMRAVLHEGTDYMTIPGTPKPSLLKPGAEKLAQWFGFGLGVERFEVERDAEGAPWGVTYRATVRRGDALVAACEGYAGYDEAQWRETVEQLEARERANAQRYQRPANPAKWAEERRAPWNTILKMAQKRAVVGAVLLACGASGLFTQDLEDEMPRDPKETPKETPKDTPKASGVKAARVTKARQRLLDAWRSASEECVSLGQREQARAALEPVGLFRQPVELSDDELDGAIAMMEAIIRDARAAAEEAS